MTITELIEWLEIAEDDLLLIEEGEFVPDHRDAQHWLELAIQYARALKLVHEESQD